MKTNKFFLKGITLIVLFSMILIEMSAQKKNEAPPPPPPPDVEQYDMRPPLNLPDLTSEQQAKIKNVDLKQMEAMTPLRNQIREKRVHLSSILTTMPVDMKVADQVADEIGKLAASILKAQIRHDQELRNLLTPDQQIIFDSQPKPFLRKPK